MSQKEQDRRVDYIEFHAADLPRIKTFYSKVFGWEFKDHGPEYTCFADGRLAGGFTTAAPPEKGGALVVIYAVDLEAIEAAVRSAGGDIVKEIYAFPGGRRFHFTDPGDNELAVWSDP